MICRPEAVGELNITDVGTQNKTTNSKLFWVVEHRKEKL